MLAPFRYRYPISALIHGLKYHDRLAALRLLARAIATAALVRHDSLPRCLVPVPLHPRRDAERGYNQSLELARRVGALLEIPVERKLLCRRRYTPPQTGLNAVARRRNLRGAFELLRPPAVRHVAVIDDVLTTGATAGAIAELLGRAGVTDVEVWVAARAG